MGRVCWGSGQSRGPVAVLWGDEKRDLSLEWRGGRHCPGNRQRSTDKMLVMNGL